MSAEDRYVDVTQESSAEDCCNRCFERRICVLFTWDNATHNCSYYAAVSGTKSARGKFSGSPYGPDGRYLVMAAGDDRAGFAEGCHGGGWCSQSEGIAASDVAFVIVSTDSGEGQDRANLSLPDDHIMLINRVASNAPGRTIVVMTHPGAVLTPWVNNRNVSATFAMFMPGEQAGPGLVDVLFNDVAPTGRLPVTFPNKDNEQRFTQQQYPGLVPHGDADSTHTVSMYSEKLEVGYRWYNAHRMKHDFLLDMASVSQPSNTITCARPPVKSSWM